ncbi:MAG: nuclear transport factor 2 family protein [Candidatus Baltobacteraceae bacterium]
MNNDAELVRRFATALDNDDYDVASECMEPDAIYEDVGLKTIVGRDAILRSFAMLQYGAATIWMTCVFCTRSTRRRPSPFDS